MKRAQDATELFDAFPAFSDPCLVPVEAGDIEAVRPADVDRPVAVEVLQMGTSGGRDNRTEVELLAHGARERERDAVGVGEAKVRESLANRVAPGGRRRIL